MNLQTRRVTWTSAGLVLALTAGMPVIADDTELMLSTPNTGGKPNILFILDTSGSMDDVVTTQEPYDPAVTYGDGVDDCDSDSIYWTDVDNAPDCGTATQFVAKSSFKCVSASGQLMGIGSYSDTMVQYRATGVPDVSRWQELQPGNSTDLVECQADAGEHGDGTVGELWASNGSNDAPFTSNENIELGWGSAPASVTYTV